MKSVVHVIAPLVLLFAAHDLIAQSNAPDAAEISAAVERFHQALMEGDRTAALELLAPDAIILESGELQSCVGGSDEQNYRNLQRSEDRQPRCRARRANEGRFGMAHPRGPLVESQSEIND
jgi:ketosteroid isomerase-like protein